LRWRADHAALSEAEHRYLDTLTYREYLEKMRGFDAAVTRMVEPIVGLLAGVSTDAACARLGRQLVQDPTRSMALSFPGGNSPFPRALLRALLPAALPGRDFDSLLYGNVDFRALDSASQSTRLRLEATALRVRHSGGNADEVVAIYEQGGRLFSVRAGQVVMASGGWVNKHLLVDMPEDLRTAYGQFGYAPALIVNVALRHWRFLYDLDITSCRWFDDTDGIGYCRNLRQNMVTERHAPAATSGQTRRVELLPRFPDNRVTGGNTGDGRTGAFDKYGVRRLRTSDPPADATAVRCIGLQSQARHRRHRAQPLGSRTPGRTARFSLRCRR
jgi:spermidine dehydrogenase